MLVSRAHAQNNLDYYLEAARQNSPLLNDTKNQTQAATLEIERLKAFYTKAQITATGNIMLAPVLNTDESQTKLELFPKPTTDYYGYDLGATNGGLYQGLITYTKPLFTAERFQVYAQQVEAGRQVNQNTIRLTEHDLEKLVTDQFILCLQDKKQMLFADSLLLLLADQCSIIKRLVDKSILKQSDLSLLNIEYEANRNVQVTYQANYYRDLQDLRILAGVPDTGRVLLQDIHLQVKESISASNYLIRYRLDSLNLMATQKVFELKYKPQLNFFTNAGLNATYLPSIPQRFGFSTGLTFNWYIFDGQQRNITRQKTAVLLQTVSFYRQNFLVQNKLRQTRYRNELESYTTRQQITQKQMQEYRSLLTTYRREIMVGQLSIINYIMALKNMALAQRDSLLLYTNEQLLINAYNYWNW
ncbi:TolC family protein (plasmid) [Adhaeribacter swui]|uniref:TolC family protein n=1 Tax=Adhaeribacter swui TaxID=2086471 RepID=A0A7G7G220_9BACT|nr:TolC family protein [Adhaeribacter swui]QNF31204.1 TolC family protein [Adhaeribacter swui]